MVCRINIAIQTKSISENYESSVWVLCEWVSAHKNGNANPEIRSREPSKTSVSLGVVMRRTISEMPIIKMSDWKRFHRHLLCIQLSWNTFVWHNIFSVSEIFTNFHVNAGWLFAGQSTLYEMCFVPPKKTASLIVLWGSTKFTQVLEAVSVGESALTVINVSTLKTQSHLTSKRCVVFVSKDWLFNYSLPIRNIHEQGGELCLNLSRNECTILA